MDRLLLMPGLLFLTADVLAIVSLVMPYWIVTKVGGDTSLGLIQTCFSLSGRDKTCFSAILASEWLITLVLIMLGIVSITATIALLFVAQSRPTLVMYARWLGFLAMVMFCLAAVLFPLGFSISEIGGEPYQLPNGYDVGIAYIAFILALWVTVVSELFAGKFCPPRI